MGAALLNIFVCEDREEQRHKFVSIIERYYLGNALDATLKVSTDKPNEILENMEVETPGLYFLDIDLNSKMDGLQLARAIKDRVGISFIVFITTHSEMTPLTFKYKVEAMDFILKDEEDKIEQRIADCIDVAYKRHLEKKAGAKFLVIHQEDMVKRIDLDEIIFIETTPVKHKLCLHTPKRTIEFYSELKKVEQELDGRFVRCHKSFIINKNQISEIDKKNNLVLMRNGDKCDCSRIGKRMLV